MPALTLLTDLLYVVMHFCFVLGRRGFETSIETNNCAYFILHISDSGVMLKVETVLPQTSLFITYNHFTTRRHVSSVTETVL